MNPEPLIQYFVAKSMVGKAVRRQSAGLEIVRGLCGLAMGRAEDLRRRAKKSLKVLWFEGSGSRSWGRVGARLKEVMKGWMWDLLSGESYSLPVGKGGEGG